MTRNTKLSTPNNRVIAPQSTCKSIKHQVNILPHWFIPSLLPLHLVGTSNSDMSHTRRRDVTLSIPIRQVLPQHDSTSVGRCKRYRFILRSSL